MKSCFENCCLGHAARLLVMGTVVSLCSGVEPPSGEDHSDANGSMPSDPVVTDPFVQTAAGQIDLAPANQKANAIDWLVAVSISLQDQEAAQALYTAGHKNYSLGRFVEAADVFRDLRTLSTATLLEVESLRMLAQIEVALAHPELAKAYCEDAQDVFLAISGLSDTDREYAAISFMPLMARLQESSGDYSAALATAQAMLVEVRPGTIFHRDALLLAGRASLDAGDMVGA